MTKKTNFRKSFFFLSIMHLFIFIFFKNGCLGNTVYTVKNHDTLMDIAYEFYHHHYCWPLIRDANHQILDKNHLKTGQVLRIPLNKVCKKPVIQTQKIITEKNKGQSSQIKFSKNQYLSSNLQAIRVKDILIKSPLPDPYRPKKIRERERKKREKLARKKEKLREDKEKLELARLNAIKEKKRIREKNLRDKFTREESIKLALRKKYDEEAKKREMAHLKKTNLLQKEILEKNEKILRKKLFIKRIEEEEEKKLIIAKEKRDKEILKKLERQYLKRSLANITKDKKQKNSDKYTIQVASFPHLVTAYKYEKSLNSFLIKKGLKIRARVEEAQIKKNQIWYRLRFGRFKLAKNAKIFANKIHLATLYRHYFVANIND